MTPKHGLPTCCQLKLGFCTVELQSLRRLTLSSEQSFPCLFSLVDQTASRFLPPPPSRFTTPLIPIACGHHQPLVAPSVETRMVVHIGFDLVKTQESFYAWVDIQEFRGIPTADYRRGKSMHIYQKYIREGAVLEVNWLCTYVEILSVCFQPRLLVAPPQNRHSVPTLLALS